MGQSTSLVSPRIVTTDGEGLVSHAGMVWLGEVADRSGLTGGLRAALADLAWRRHDPGRCLAEMIVALADGAECLSDFAVVADQPTLFGPAASRPTLQRVIRQLGPANLRGIAGARAQARAAAWAAGAGPQASKAIIDLDSTIIPTKANKEDATKAYKQGCFGHHPLLAMIAETGEMLTGLFRAGRASAWCAADHVTVLDAAIDQLPFEWQSGHHLGDNPLWVQRGLAVRADSAGASHWLADECAARNIEFSLGYSIDQHVIAALSRAQEEDWEQARNTNSTPRKGAQVTELTELWDPKQHWPAGTRIVVRRERPHVGAQLSLFDDIEGWRHSAFITNSCGDPVSLELRHRQRGHAEQTIRDTKACGLSRLPFDAATHNDTWMQLCFAANDLLAWAKHISLTGPMRKATPKTLRYRLLHTAAHISPRRLRLDRNWPWATTLQHAIEQTRTQLQPLNVSLTPAIHPGL